MLIQPWITSISNLYWRLTLLNCEIRSIKTHDLQHFLAILHQIESYIKVTLLEMMRQNLHFLVLSSHG